ncbi:MAG: DUF421 domain-containing protein, partial [Candidatus Rokuibacteriota bacterium]
MEAVLGLAVRATVTYLYLLVILRVAGKRVIAAGTPFDLVVALVVGDFSDDLILGEVAAAQGLVAMGGVMLLHGVVTWASYRSTWFDRLAGSGSRLVIRDGRLDRDGLRRERLNEADIAAALRQHGIEDPWEVAEARLEPTGRVSVRRAPEARRVSRRDAGVGPAT